MTNRLEQFTDDELMDLTNGLRTTWFDPADRKSSLIDEFEVEKDLRRAKAVAEMKAKEIHCKACNSVLGHTA
jgi:hypothetical protein